MRLISVLIAAFVLINTLAAEDFICRSCNSKAEAELNFTFTEAFKSSFNKTGVVDNILLSDLRTGICETTFIVRDNKFYAHNESRSLRYRDKKNNIYLRHKEFFVPLLEMFKKTEEILGVKLPAIIFNLETQDNPTCRYPVTEI